MQITHVPALQEGTWVICDRFADSTTAYQGGGHMIDDDKIQHIHEVTIGPLSPDLTFIFKLDPEQGLKRTHSREHQEDRFEQFDTTFHQRVAKKYEEISRLNPDRCITVDASQDIETLAEQIWQHVKTRFIKDA